MCFLSVIINTKENISLADNLRDLEHAFQWKRRTSAGMGFAAGKVRYHKVAVDCWFTAAGRTIPRMIKYQDDAGCIHLIKELQVHQSQRRRSGGLLVQRYDCSVVQEGIRRDFVLWYHPGENTWDMALAGQEATVGGI